VRPTRLLTDADFLRPSPIKTDLMTTSDFAAARRNRPTPTHRQQQDDAFARLLDWFNEGKPQAEPVRAAPIRKTQHTVGAMVRIADPKPTAIPEGVTRHTAAPGVTAHSLPSGRKALSWWRFETVDLPAFRKPFGMSFQAV